MALMISFNIKHLLLILILLFASTFVCKSVSLTKKEDEDEDEEPHYHPEDPALLVAKALLCFNDKLTQSGHINVPYEATDLYCNGPCLEETHLVLDCVDHILSNFLFYNKATIGDIRATVKAACSYGDERGHFDVAEHLESDHGVRIASPRDVLMVILMCLGVVASLLWPCGL